MLKGERIKMILSVAMILATLVSCRNVINRPNELEATVPLSSTIIVQTNLDALLKKAGCKSEMGVITLSDEMTKLLSVDSCFLNLISQCASHGNIIDLSELYLFGQTPSTLVGTARIKDDDFSRRTGNYAVIDSKQLGSIKLMSLGEGISMVVDEHQVWVAKMDSLTLAHTVDSIMNDARFASVATAENLHNFFNNNVSVKIRCRLLGFSDLFGERFNEVYASANVTDRVVTLKAECASDGVKVNPFSDMLDIDSIAVVGMPMGSVLSINFGLNHTLVGRLPLLMERISLKEKILLGMVAELIDENGGTFSIAIAPGGRTETLKRGGLSAWMLRLAIPAGKKGEAAAAIVNNFFSEDIYAESDSSYLQIWNYDPFLFEEFYHTSTDMEISVQEGEKGALFINIPYRSEVMKAFNLKRGYSLKATFADSIASASLRILGPSTYILPSVIEDIERFRFPGE